MAHDFNKESHKTNELEQSEKKRIPVFILIIVPLVKNRATLFGVSVTLVFCLLFKFLHFEMGLILSGLMGMISATLWAKIEEKNI